MKLANRTQLMQLPPGTVYMEHDWARAFSLLVKGDTITHDGKNIDWVVAASVPGEYSGFAGSPSPADLTDPRAIPTAVEDGWRDGLFDDGVVYIVFERADVQAVISLLTASLATAYVEAK